VVSEGEASLRPLVTYPRVRLWGYGALEEVWVLVGGRARVSIGGVRPPVAFFARSGFAWDLHRSPVTAGIARRCGREKSDSRASPMPPSRA
jgi:hypothetical protein